MIQEEASFEVSPVKEDLKPRSTRHKDLKLNTGMAWTNVEAELEEEEELEATSQPKTATLNKPFFVSEKNDADVETTRSKGNNEPVLSEIMSHIKLEECDQTEQRIDEIDSDDTVSVVASSVNL